MPVKVRCPECEKVLTLPDQARGKVAKCSNCEARVPVPRGSKPAGPARKKAVAKKARKSAGGGEEEVDDVLAKMDLSRAEDFQVRVCPKCGLEVDEEDIECPKCGVVIATGRLSAEKQKKKARGGPDPDKYFETFLTEGWEFVKEHWQFGVRTMIYLMVVSAVCIGAGFMMIYTSKLPLKVFWGTLGLLFLMVGPGWCWFLHTTLIEWSVEKKLKLDRIRFDFFTCAALGIKFFSWLIVFCAPFQVVFGTIGGLLIANDMLAGGLVLIAIGFLPGFFCFPAVMSHMSMPIQWPGWLSPRIVPQYFQGMVGASMYWCMFTAAFLLPATILWAVAVFAFQEDLTKLVEDMNHNARVDHVLDMEEPKQKTGEAEEIQGRVETELSAVAWWFFATKDQKLEERKYWSEQGGGSTPASGSDAKPSWERELDAEAIIPPIIIWILACAPFAFAAVFAMRTNGLFTYYFQPELHLLREEKQVKWRRKKKHGDEVDGDMDEEADILKYVLGTGGTILFYVVVNVILYFTSGYVLLPAPIARALNLLSE